MDNNDNAFRIRRIKFRSRNIASTVGEDHDGNKQFCSFGHMRFDCETKMEKGLLFQPATLATATLPSSLSSSPSAAATDDVVDCSKFLSYWPVTGRRGRKGTSSTTSSNITTATAVDVISSDQPNTKRVKIDTHSDHETPLKKKVHSDEKKNGVLEKEYKCNVCSKVFTNPRALGGHKSSHYKANKTDIAIKNETTTSEPKITMSLDSSTDRTNQRRVRDFNLNELPPGD